MQTWRSVEVEAAATCPGNSLPLTVTAACGLDRWGMTVSVAEQPADGLVVVGGAVIPCDGLPHAVSGQALINAGDPQLLPPPEVMDIDGEPRLQGCRVDMGADEATMNIVAADADQDADVDLADFGPFQICFGTIAADDGDSPDCLCIFDLDHSGVVDLVDFALFDAAFTGPAAGR